jgi:hypothetical protein
MSETATNDTKAPEAPLQPDQLDAVAMQLVGLQQQLIALTGMVQASLILVQQLLVQRGRSGTLPPLTRQGLGLPPQPDVPRSFNQSRPADGASGPTQ